MRNATSVKVAAFFFLFFLLGAMRGAAKIELSNFNNVHAPVKRIFNFG